MTSLADGEARRRACTDLDHNLVVDAGAGTGKTTILIERILSLIASGRCALPRIAAITFTEKAAGELKLRLRLEIERRLAGLSESAEAGYLRIALEDIDRAHVSTIHAFCAAVLRERPAEAGVDPAFTVIDQLGAFVLRHRVWEQWIGAELSQSNQLVADALALGVSADALKRLADYLIDHRDVLALLPARVAVGCDAFVERLSRVMPELRRLRGDCIDATDSAFRQIAELDRASSELQGLEEGARRAVLLGRIRIHQRGNLANWRPSSSLRRVKQIVGSLRQEVEELASDLGHDLCVGLADWLGGNASAYEAAKRKLGVLDFDDLLLKTRELLRRDHAIRRHWQRRFQALLVDEFQDTDPLQAEIVFFLAERLPRAAVWQDVELQPGKLFLVGDPKQSIYRFRRADIELYAEAKRVATGQGAAIDLTTNFRSRPALIEWINDRFTELIRAPAGGGSHQPEYVPLTAPPEQSVEGPAAVCLLALPPAQENRSGDQWLGLEARAVAEVVGELVRGRASLVRDAPGSFRPLRYRDVAILFRDNDSMHVFEDELRHRGLPYRVAGGRRFYRRDEIVSLLSVLRALADPNDQVNLLATLRGPWFGFSDEQIYLFRSSGGRLDYQRPTPAHADHGSELGAAFDLLHELHRYSTSVGPVALLQALLDRSPHVLPLFYLRPDGDQRVANLLKVMDIARAVESEGVHTLKSFARFLGDLERLQAEEGESPVTEQADDVLHLMTIHKAKGLEFPVVVLADGRRDLRFRPPTGIADRLRGEMALRLGRIRTRNWEALEQREEERSEAEEIRLLYVAATRARDWLVLPQYPREARGSFLGRLIEGAPAEVYTIHAGDLDLKPRPARAFRTAWMEGEYESVGSETAEEWKARRATEIDRAAARDRFYSPSSLADEAKGAGEAPVIAGALHGRRSARVGTLVHALLQRVDLAEPSGLEDIAAALGAERGLDATEVKEAGELARRALALPVMERVRRASESYREVPFIWKSGGDTVEGAVDLVFRERGELVIVDFKTDDVETSDEIDARCQLHRPQAAVYAAAMEEIAAVPVREVVLAFVRPFLEKRLRGNWRLETRQILSAAGVALREQASSERLRPP